jgi:hypothetical protein
MDSIDVNTSVQKMETALAKSLYELRKGDFMLSQCIPKSLYENKFLNRAKVEIKDPSLEIKWH